MEVEPRTTEDLICEVEFVGKKRFVYIPRKDMSTEIAAQLRAIADTLDQGGTVTGGPRRPKVILQTEWPTDPRNPNRKIPPQPKWVPDENGDAIAAEDFWVDGIPGALKGTRNSHYVQSMIYSIIGTGDYPKHFHIFIPAPKDMPWIETVRSPSQLGWMNGEDYRFDPSISDRKSVV